MPFASAAPQLLVAEADDGQALSLGKPRYGLMLRLRGTPRRSIASCSGICMTGWRSKAQGGGVTAARAGEIHVAIKRSAPCQLVAIEPCGLAAIAHSDVKVINPDDVVRERLTGMIKTSMTVRM
jgi:hypothetical protein